MKYRKKPVVIEAIKYEGVESIPKAKEFVGNDFVIGPSGYNGKSYDRAVAIETLDGRTNISKGDYIIKGVQGEFYTCKPDIFEATYELEAEPSPHS